MGSHVIVSGELLIRSHEERAFLDAWGDGFSDDHQHSWLCIARHFGNASVRTTPAGDVTVSIDRWSELDYLAAALVERVAPHVASGRLAFAYEFDESEAWTVDIGEGEVTEE
ncbi:MAG TPA: hypothetical protein VF395_03405 [Polyangiaceae bacterium]